MKNDGKIIISLFIIELFLLSILTSIAATRAKKIAFMDLSDYSLEEQLDSVRAFKRQCFSDSLYLNYHMSDYDDIENAEPKELYNYYTFSFTEEGIQANFHRNKDGLTSGLLSSTVEEDLLMIKACGKNSTEATELSFGNLTILNPYLKRNLSLQEVLEEPLVLRKLSGIHDVSVFMYHTHTEEGYCLSEADQRNSKWDGATSDSTQNVVGVSQTMCSILESYDIHGFADATRHQRGPNSTYDYSQSRKTLIRLLEEYQQAELALDIHRDAAGMSNGRHYGPVVTDENGVNYAQVMFVLGLNYDTGGNPDDRNNPYWKENFKLALLMIAKLEERVPGICRGISIRTNPYNQDLAKNTLLTEIGFNGNLVSEAQATGRLMAEILAEIYS